jgi:hypothetical protein
MAWPTQLQLFRHPRVRKEQYAAQTYLRKLDQSAARLIQQRLRSVSICFIDEWIIHM